MKRYNPGKSRITVVEMPHEPERFNPRGGPNTADHVDILGRQNLNELVLRVAAGKGDTITDYVVSNIREYADKVDIYEEGKGQLNECVSTECDSTYETIDNALRTWLDVTSKFRDRDSDSQDDVLVCAHLLLESPLFKQNNDYVRTQIIHSLLQEDEAASLHAIASLLFLDGRLDESTFPRMISEDCFPRLLELIKSGQDDDDPRLHRLLLQLMYEMSRVERLKLEDLMLVDDAFIHYLFRIIEGVSDDVQDPYHYPTIRVLVSCPQRAVHAGVDGCRHRSDRRASALTNRIVKCLSLHGPQFRTFGENIILLLNRETETSLQLLILKLLYLLFTTKATYEYFYTNDLRVLLDVIIRNLMDLPDEKMSLRHTYLRVMYPLLAHTQLSQPPHYKSEEIVRVLRILRGSQNAHFAPADETTLRLVDRVTKVKWLEESMEERATPPQGEGTPKYLGISLSPSQYASSISVGDVAGVKERPGVQTPSRHAVTAGLGATTEARSHEDIIKVVKTKKPLPAVPKHKHGTPFVQIPHIQVNGSGKKIPPKAPPPRRAGRLKSTSEPSPAEPTIPE
ncbi:hypothetical protein ACCO45_014026 [Purpureocillium lilacinum]|uniref:Uncharacterized protein n=1 Tax=Purpureocillium lilacinum TaxID=33203 RepID=A0ACC4D7S7_PURLI